MQNAPIIRTVDIKGTARPAEIVRVIVREPGTRASQTSRKQFPSRIDFLGLLYRVCWRVVHFPPHNPKGR